MRNITYLLILFIIIHLFGCKDNGENPTQNPGLASDSIKVLGVNDFSVELSQRGELARGNLKSGSSTINCIYLAGLWIGMEDNGTPQGNIISTNSIPKGNFTSKWTDKQLGVFSINPDNKSAATNWPAAFGAPTDGSGLPKIYGDEMCWTSLTSDTTIKDPLFLSRPINGLRVTQAVYGYKRDDLRNTIFIKYGITNLSSRAWNNVYIGFYSDTDLDTAFNNKTGYDSARSLTFTYDTTSNYVTGFKFLETPKNSEIKSHRIMRKNNYINPDFGEYSFTSPEQILYALNGLSNSGLPMINPVTGLETNFAFTGDPVSKTGWLDVAVDVRSMISAGPFSLIAGETAWVTVVWVINKGANLEDSLTKLKLQTDQINSDISLWGFH